MPPEGLQERCRTRARGGRSASSLLTRFCAAATIGRTDTAARRTPMSEDSAPTGSPPAPPGREFVAHRLRRNSLIASVLFGLAFVAILQSPDAPGSRRTKYVVLGVT